MSTEQPQKQETINITPLNKKEKQNKEPQRYRNRYWYVEIC